MVTIPFGDGRHGLRKDKYIRKHKACQKKKKKKIIWVISLSIQYYCYCLVRKKKNRTAVNGIELNLGRAQLACPSFFPNLYCAVELNGFFSLSSPSSYGRSKNQLKVCFFSFFLSQYLKTDFFFLSSKRNGPQAPDRPFHNFSLGTLCWSRMSCYGF